MSQRPDATTFRGLDDERLARAGHDQLGHAIEVGVDGPDAVHRQALLPARPVRGILRGDEVLERREAHV